MHGRLRLQYGGVFKQPFMISDGQYRDMTDKLSKYLQSKWYSKPLPEMHKQVVNILATEIIFNLPLSVHNLKIGFTKKL